MKERENLTTEGAPRRLYGLETNVAIQDDIVKKMEAENEDLKRILGGSDDRLTKVEHEIAKPRQYDAETCVSNVG